MPRLPGAPREPRLDLPREPRRTLRPHYDPDAFGRFSERIARFLGTARFLVYMSVFIVLWLVWNVVAPGDLAFDPYTFTFLTLLLSLQASYAAPLILLAQNRQDDRDRVNLEQDRSENVALRAEVDYLTREIAALRNAVGEVATRDYLRSELNRVVEELVETAEGVETAKRQRRTKRRHGEAAETPDPVDHAENF
jgi:uncharacterized membrane protein